MYQTYLGYNELYKFLNLLGTVFGWVATDVLAKMEVLRGHINGENAEKYQSIQSMVQYEMENDLIKYKAKDSTTGTRNLLRLHRALEYIVAFLEGVPGLQAEDKCCPLSQEAYSKTLMKFHPWVVQKVSFSRNFQLYRHKKVFFFLILGCSISNAHASYQGRIDPENY